MSGLLNTSLVVVQVEEQVKQLQKGVTHIGVGTPGRISALVEKGTRGAGRPRSTSKLSRSRHDVFSSAEGLNLRALKYLVLDWNWRDQKLRRMVDVPEVSYCPLLEDNETMQRHESQQDDEVFKSLSC